MSAHHPVYRIVLFFLLPLCCCSNKTPIYTRKVKADWYSTIVESGMSTRQFLLQLSVKMGSFVHLIEQQIQALDFRLSWLTFRPFLKNYLEMNKLVDLVPKACNFCCWQCNVLFWYAYMIFLFWKLSLDICNRSIPIR